MADLITLANSVKVTKGTSTVLRQDVLEAIDVSFYDRLDLQVALFALTTTGDGVRIGVLTSMQNKSDDGSWRLVAEVPLGPSPLPDWQPLTTVPGPLYRYVRYQVDFRASATAATFSITGFARRESL